jgi:hypothetical protein
MKQRIHIEKLIVTGNGVKDATLRFDKGVNLIIGSSDTGKSYIFQCIDYLLGGGNIPKIIPEANGYTDAYLQIKTSSDEVFTIHRNLKTISKASVTETVYEKYGTSNKRILGTQNDTLEGENISEFLLKLIGIENIKIITNASNKTKKLSFRDIARLSLIDESRIITEESPVYTSANNYYELTGEKSAFKYLLTENFDNELIEKEDKKVFESRIKGKLEFIESLLLSKNNRIEKLQSSVTNPTSEEINERILSLLEKLESSSINIEKITLERENNFKELHKLKSSNLQNIELLKRFYLLAEHYKNDLNRLNFILEGKFLFEQLITKDCPICGTNMDENHLKCLAEKVENKSISESIKIESQKIEIKLNDLNATIKSTERDKNLNMSLISSLEDKLAVLNKNLNSELIPLQENFKNEINQLMSYNKVEQEIINAKNDITNLHSDKDLLDRELKSKPKFEEAKIELEYSILKLFSEHVEKFLRAWNFPGLSTVEFDKTHKVFDLIISNRGRNSHGKGVRAISYSAFIFGLLDYCIEKSKPHSGFIVLDSPLTTYHNNQKPQSGDEISLDMQDAFFKDLTNVNESRQIIILDNKMPNENLTNNFNLIKFSNDGNRKGFFPM